MESQINSLETRIEKMQERFNKDLEEIKKEVKLGKGLRPLGHSHRQVTFIPASDINLAAFEGKV